jgi:hypothetical protein
VELLSEQATPPSRHQIVASVVRGQRATRGIGPVCGQTDHWVECQKQQSPSPKMVPYQCIDIVKAYRRLLLISIRGSERSLTPMPGVTLQSPIRDLIPIESSAGPSQDKGKGKAVDLMDKERPERERSVSLTVSEFKGAFHGGSSAFVYDWINDEHDDSSPEGPWESVDDWLTDQSYMDANEDPIE